MIDNFFGNTRIGIIGAGNLGLVIAKIIMEKEIVGKKRFYLSCRGSAKTISEISKASLDDCLRSNVEICKEADIIFLAIRPQDLPSLFGLEIPTKSRVISLVAATDLMLLEQILGKRPISRAMVCGAEAIANNEGIAGLVSNCQDNYTRRLLELLGCNVIALPEQYAHYFCTLTSLHAMFVLSKECEILQALHTLQSKFPKEILDMEKIYDWANSTAPKRSRHDSIDNILSALATKGGITEAMIESFELTQSTLEAIKAGARRSAEILNKNRKVISDLLENS